MEATLLPWIRWVTLGYEMYLHTLATSSTASKLSSIHWDDWEAAGNSTAYPSIAVAVSSLHQGVNILVLSQKSVATVVLLFLATSDSTISWSWLQYVLPSRISRDHWVEDLGYCLRSLYSALLQDPRGIRPMQMWLRQTFWKRLCRTCAQIGIWVRGKATKYCKMLSSKISNYQYPWESNCECIVRLFRTKSSMHFYGRIVSWIHNAVPFVKQSERAHKKDTTPHHAK